MTLRVAKDLAAEYGASVEVKDFEGSAWGYVRGHRIVLKPKYAKDPDTLIGMVMQGVKYKNGYTKSDYGWFKREVIESYR